MPARPRRELALTGQRRRVMVSATKLFIRMREEDRAGTHGNQSRRDRRASLSPLDLSPEARAERLHVQPVPGGCRRAAALPLWTARALPGHFSIGGADHGPSPAALDWVQLHGGRGN